MNGKFGMESGAWQKIDKSEHKSFEGIKLKIIFVKILIFHSLQVLISFYGSQKSAALIKIITFRPIVSIE